MGYILLEGGAEFGGGMAQPDIQALTLAGGPSARLSIIPAAAAPDNNHQQAGENGVQWFRGLGATHVRSLPLIDRASANTQDIADALAKSQFIYILGGFPHYLAQTLLDSLCWQSILAAFKNGAVVAGSSAGAMVLCQHYYDPMTKKIEKGLNLIRGACVLPHHNTFGKGWAKMLLQRLPEILLIGIDEETGMISDDSLTQWRVHGKGPVILYRQNQTRSFPSEQSFALI